MELLRETVKADTTRHKQQRETDRTAFEREETRKDNDLRRLRDQVLFVAVMVGALAMLSVGTYVGLWSDQPEATKQRAWSLVSLIVGGFVGYIAGRSTSKQ